jgi:predicted nucleic acid-binding protein
VPAALVDTNLLVYAHDPAAGAKQDRAIRTLEVLRATGQGRLSVQTLAEFFAVATRGRRRLLAVEDALAQVEGLALGWPVLDVTPLVVVEAARGVRDHRLAYWDAQLWATARLNQVGVVFTEDIPSGPTLEGVRYVNPLAPEFDIAPWS